LAMEKGLIYLRMLINGTYREAAWIKY